MNDSISDTDILSTFGKIGRLDLLQRLFHEIHVAPAVYQELLRVQQLGLAWLPTVIETIKPLPLTREEIKKVGQLVTSYPQLGSGEIETLVLAKTHRLICLTNDRQAKRVCQLLGLPNLDLEEILRALKIKKIIDAESLSEVIDQIEQKDHTHVKAKKQIIRD